MTKRWVLGRAGITNVYQYGDEVIHFAGGRLLLRGVNGSGKSTAMNMLLPWLLDGDTRRIDAAGEQSGVLRSWMLTGRDDPQPVGYLWLELERGDDHICFGCGIKANRASDTVSTWWWVTARRPGIDLSLVEDNRPLSAEALRAELGGDPVFRHDQRGAYREEIRNRLFAGADLDGHIRLLHIVRNPRVGDRVDLDLPAHLHDALPRLSDRALADAAQPLDELEEHRRNVTELQHTAATLDALVAVYADYARVELRRRATDAATAASDAERARRDAARAERVAAERDRLAATAASAVDQLSRTEGRLRSELTGLREAPAYRAGRDLEDLRALVGRLSRAVSEAEARLAERDRDLAGAARDLREASGAAGADHDRTARLLEDLTAAVVDVGLPVAAPDLPAPRIEPLDADGSLGAPAGRPELDGLRRRLEALRAAVAHRRGDLEAVRRELDALDEAEARLARAGLELEAAEKDAALRHEAHSERARQLAGTGAEWLSAVHEWLALLAAHCEAAGIPTPTAPDLSGDPVRDHPAVSALLDRLATAAGDHHADALGALRSRAANHDVEVLDARRNLAELEAVTLPPPPALAWQRAERAPVLAEVVDFCDELGDAERAGLEGALEASGLLSAEVTTDGALAGVDGTLLVRPGPTVAAPLRRLLRVTAGLTDPDEVAAIEALLAAVTTDLDRHPGAQGEATTPGAVAAGSAPDREAPAGSAPEGQTSDREAPEAAVGVDGRFRVGPLRGRHRKERAEHIGGPARAAALERLRVDARSRLEAAQEAAAATAEAIRTTEAWLADVRGLRDRVPSTEALTRARAETDAAARDARAAEEMLVERSAALSAAETVHAETVEAARRTATSLGLPATRPGLRTVEDGLTGVDRLTAEAGAGVTVWARAVDAWGETARRWRAASDARRRAEAAVSEADGEHRPAAARLATVEDAVGADYEEIRRAVIARESELAVAGQDLVAARDAEIAAASDAATARSESVVAEQTAARAAAFCSGLLPGLRAALAVPGLLDAAVDDPAALHQPVEESPAGVRELADRLSAQVPGPGRPDIGADGVRQSLRQRRDALGAGWDAEDHQPDAALPLAVEVTGPEGRMPLTRARATVAARASELGALLSAEQDHALRNLLQGLVAQEVADKLRAAGDLVERMNARLASVTTAHGIGVSLRWRRRDDLAPDLSAMVELLAKPPDLRDSGQDDQLRAALAARLDDARREDPDAPYRDLVGRVLDYRSWYDITVLLRRPGQNPERLGRRTALSEGEKKIVSYLPLFAAVAASCDALGEQAPAAPRFVLLDDAFAKVSEDNHAMLFGLLVELDLDFIATSERLWGTHASVPELAITEVIRDAALGVIVLEHSAWEAASGLVRTGG